MENTVELIGYYGGDETHACSAWTSTHREITPERQARLPAFLKQLAENGHHTPFEKSMLHFLVDSEVASHIHLLKHRIGVSVNAESARYKEFKEDRFYVPDDWPLAFQVGLGSWYREASEYYHHLCNKLTPILGRKRAKESARFVLPYGHQLTSDISFNFRSFVHFYNLRHDPNEAQVEIAAIAEKMLELVRATGAFTHSIAAFNL